MKRSSKLKTFIFSFLSILLIASFIFLIISFSNKNSNIKSELPVFSNSYSTTAKHGYYFQQLGTVERSIPAALNNEGLEQGYPIYGSTQSLTETQKTQVIQEAISLCGKKTSNTGGTYDKMDENGYLYLSDGTPVLDDEGNHRKLYKHSASVGLYYGDIDDNEKAVIKKITFLPRAYSNSYNLTGLYAPAGEIIKIEMSEEDFRACGGITIHIGQALYNGQNNNIWAKKNINRMPVILNTMVFNESNSYYDENAHIYTCYVGSYLGGPIYIRNTNVKVSVTISGAVNYRHFILGQTTKAEFEELCKSSAPYFDLEVWDNGILHSGPLKYAKSFSYDDLYKVAILWEKISLVSTQYRNYGIVGIYDPFVAAGAAVAFPGRASFNCPADWMTNALNYNVLVSSGAWGVLHEYNHNYQGWGLPNGGEVTNNALTLTSYSHFTNISSLRNLSSSGESGLSGWNCYTSASWSLNQVLNGDYNGTNQLSIYSTLLHNIGQKNFVLCTNVSGTTNYFNRLCDVTDYDMSYFFELVNQVPDQNALESIKQQNLPMFVPVSSIYQTGRSILVDGQKEYITTMQPYMINFGQKIRLDLSKFTKQDGEYIGGSIVIPEGFSYIIKNVSAPDYGALQKIDEYTYEYTPNESYAQSGKIYVTLGIAKNDNAFLVDDIDLVFEFKQSHELNKNKLERTVYKYDSNIFTSAKEAYETNYAGFIEVINEDNINPVQNSNSEIWVPNPSNNAVMEVNGKLFIENDGDYRIALRGRHSCALYISLDGGVNYFFAAELNHNTNKNDWWDIPSSYIDLKNLHAGEFIYFKEVLLVDYNSAFVGLGLGKFEKVNGTINENGDFVDGNGNIIEDLEPTVSITYANAYRCSYQFETEDFESDYLFRKNYNFTYDGSKKYTNKGSLIQVSGYTPWDGFSTQMEELFDDNDENYIHSKKGANYDITSENPFIMTVDLGEELLVSQMTIYGSKERQYQPKDFILYGGNSLDDMQEIVNVTGAQKTGENVIVNFDACKIRYYRIYCTATFVSSNPVGMKYIAFKSIGFDLPFILSNGTQIAPDDSILTYKGTWEIKNKTSSFGRIYVGEKDSILTFDFIGSYLAINSFSSIDYENFEVYIDDAFIQEVSINSTNNKTITSFISNKLKNEKHTVKIICKGRINIDSIVYWQ